MAKIEIVKVTHTYIIRRDGEEMPEIPEPAVKMHTRNARGLVVEYEETTEGALPIAEAPPLLAFALHELSV
jgi:hypothetical protein